MNDHTPALKQDDPFAIGVVDAMPMLKAFARKLCRDEAKADDLVQETMTKALANRDKFEIGTNISAWLGTIMRNTFLSSARRGKREVEDVDGDYSRNLASADNPEVALELAQVEEAIDALPENMRNALRDAAEGLSIEEQATRRGIAEGTAKSRLHRSRTALTDSLNRAPSASLATEDAEDDDTPAPGVVGTLHPILPLGEDLTGATINGEIGQLEILPISKLFIDDTYQRAVSSRSVRVIRRICREFDWAMFLPVIVTRDDDHYCIVDGQHRTTAAATIGITEVPCYVLSCTPAEAAAAFAAINGNVTPVQPLDLWFAELAAGERSCVALQRVLDAASVKVTRKKEGFLVGETRSINVLRRAYDFYGAAILTTILQCIVETGDGNPGMIFGAIINGIGRAIRTKPELLTEPSKLFKVFDNLSLSQMLYEGKIEYARTANPVQNILTRDINTALRAEKVEAIRAT